MRKKVYAELLDVSLQPPSPRQPVPPWPLRLLREGLGKRRKPPHKNRRKLSFLSQASSMVLSPSQSHSDKEGQQELSLLAMHPRTWPGSSQSSFAVGWGTSPQHSVMMGTPHLSGKLKSIPLERQTSCLRFPSHLPGGHGQRVWMDRRLGTDCFRLLLLRVAAGHLRWQKKGLISLVPPKSPGPVLIPRGLSTFGVCTIAESLIACPHATQFYFFFSPKSGSFLCCSSANQIS